MPVPRSSFIEPFLPSPADRPPSGPGWLHEIKHDGSRRRRSISRASRAGEDHGRGAEDAVGDVKRCLFYPIL
jgi:ATP-dependent DNA ligase